MPIAIFFSKQLYCGFRRPPKKKWPSLTTTTGKTAINHQTTMRKYQRTECAQNGLKTTPGENTPKNALNAENPKEIQENRKTRKDIGDI